MMFNGAVASRMPTTLPGRYAGEDNGWFEALAFAVMFEFNQSIIKYPSLARVPGGASNDLVLSRWNRLPDRSDLSGSKGVAAGC